MDEVQITRTLDIASRAFEVFLLPIAFLSPASHYKNIRISFYTLLSEIQQIFYLKILYFHPKML